MSNKNFFLSPYYTEFFTPTGECWLYGDQLNKITKNTPRVCLGAYNEKVWGVVHLTPLPIDKLDKLEFVLGFPFEGLSMDLGCFRAEKIEQAGYNCNLIAEV